MHAAPVSYQVPSRIPQTNHIVQGGIISNIVRCWRYPYLVYHVQYVTLWKRRCERPTAVGGVFRRSRNGDAWSMVKFLLLLIKQATNEYPPHMWFCEGAASCLRADGINHDPLIIIVLVDHWSLNFFVIPSFLDFRASFFSSSPASYRMYKWRQQSFPYVWYCSIIPGTPSTW